MSFIELAAAVGVACGAAIGVFTLLEKITGAGSRWLARGVQAGVEPLAVEVAHVKESVEEVQHLQRYHLGPNGDSRRIHERVEAIERAVMGVRLEQVRIRSDAEAGPAPHVDWNGPYDD
jgi:hypothetical protein